jgi:hypothetical protein
MVTERGPSLYDAMLTEAARLDSAPPAVLRRTTMPYPIASWLERALSVSLLCCLACTDDRIVATSVGVDAGKTQGADAATQPAAASGGAAGLNGLPRLSCTEHAPPEGVRCGTQTCGPLSAADVSTCIVPCCVVVSGEAYCGTKSAAGRFSSGCALPGAPDPTCDEVVQWQGCCDAVQHACGVLLPLQSGCVTESTFTTLPEHPKICGYDDDAGTEPDAGL